MAKITYDTKIESQSLWQNYGISNIVRNYTNTGEQWKKYKDKDKLLTNYIDYDLKMRKWKYSPLCSKSSLS